MKKTTTLLFLGLALMSFRASAQDSMFADFAATSETKSAVVETSTHPLMQEDNKYLSNIETKQKNITLMQLQLKEKELEFKVIEQARKLDNLINPIEEVVAAPISCEVQEDNSASLFNRLMPAPGPTNVAPVATIAKVIAPAPAPVKVKSIKGLQGNLKATLSSDDFGTSVVSVGDVLNNGYKVTNITTSNITLESPEGDVETVGIAFSM